MTDGCTWHPKNYYQVGAPSLVYHEQSDRRAIHLDVPGDKFPELDAASVQETLKQQNRVKARWNYSEHLDQIEKVTVVKKSYKRKRGRKQPSQPQNPSTNDSNRMQRFGMLLECDLFSEKAHHKIVQDYDMHSRKYLQNSSSGSSNNSARREAGPRYADALLGRMHALHNFNNSHPAYLAPFGREALQISLNRDPVLQREDLIDRSKTESLTPRLPQGNCLLCLPCPCPNCSAANQLQSWCLVHPKGLLLDRLTVSNVIPPNGVENSGHCFSLARWSQASRQRKEIKSLQNKFPNELFLGDTILEIKKGGSWDNDNPACVFVVRTSTHVSVVLASVELPVLGRRPHGFDTSLCWGNYSLKEQHRIDLRSYVPSLPSFRPVSIACHPKYGNMFTGPMFAFVSHSDHCRDKNTIHHCYGSGVSRPNMHPIPSLRTITAIDFSRVNPMCLWAAAASYTRPTLIPNMPFKKEPLLGFGTSLYNIDLRTNVPTFQWSPSAEEMTTEGVHSISGILNDWEREFSLWVASRSARTTWEIDTRMPCRSVTRWSITGGCEDASVSFPQNGIFGDPCLLTKITSLRTSAVAETLPLLNVDSTPGAFGIHLFQPPIEGPRFQTESLETTAPPHLLKESGGGSCSFSSVFPLAEVADDVYTCGIAGLRAPLHSFFQDGELDLGESSEMDMKIVCTFTLTNKGDVYCHSLLESSTGIAKTRSSGKLPIGTSAIPVTTYLDGRTKALIAKGWKPTGGRNIKLFLSNEYPTPRRGVYASREPPFKQSYHTKVKRETHPSSKENGQTTKYNVQTDISAVRVSASNGSQILSTTRAAITIPRAISGGGKNPKFDSKSKNDHGSNRESLASDVSPGLIQAGTKMWGLWNELDSDSEDEESDNTVD